MQIFKKYKFSLQREYYLWKYEGKHLMEMCSTIELSKYVKTLKKIEELKSRSK